MESRGDVDYAQPWAVMPHTTECGDEVGRVRPLSVDSWLRAGTAVDSVGGMTVAGKWERGVFYFIFMGRIPMPLTRARAFVACRVAPGRRKSGNAARVFYAAGGGTRSTHDVGITGGMGGMNIKH